MSKGITFGVYVDLLFVNRHQCSFETAGVLSYLLVTTGSRWQKTYVDDDGNVWYWMASSKIEGQLPGICKSRRTTERYWQRLRDHGFIDTLTIDNKHYYRLTAVCDEWNNGQVPPNMAVGTDTCDGTAADTSDGTVPTPVTANKITNNKYTKDKEKGDSLSTATPKKPNPRILAGAMTECDGECQYDHPSQLCQPCKERRPKAKTFGQNMFKNLERSELWQGYFEPAKAATIAKNWFSLDHDYESREVAQELDRMIADSKFNAQKPIAISTAIERAAVNLEMRR